MINADDPIGDTIRTFPLATDLLVATGLPAQRIRKSKEPWSPEFFSKHFTVDRPDISLKDFTLPPEELAELGGQVTKLRRSFRQLAIRKIMSGKDLDFLDDEEAFLQMEKEGLLNRKTNIKPGDVGDQGADEAAFGFATKGKVRAQQSNRDYREWAIKQSGCQNSILLLRSKELQAAIQQVSYRGATRGVYGGAGLPDTR